MPNYTPDSFVRGADESQRKYFWRCYEAAKLLRDWNDDYRPSFAMWEYLAGRYTIDRLASDLVAIYG